MTELTAELDLVCAVDPGDHVIGDVRGPRRFVQVTGALRIAPTRKRSDAVAVKIGGGRRVIRDCVRDHRKIGRVLTRDRSVAFITVDVAVGEVIQNRGTEDVVPVETAYPRIFRICGAGGTELDR